MSEIRKQKIINRRSLPGLLHCAAQPAGWPSQQPAQPTSLLCRLRPDRGRGVWPARARATAPRHLSPCLPALPLLASMPWTTPRLSPCSLSLSLALSFLSLALSLARPNTTVAAVRHSHRPRPPLAPPISSGAPPRLPLPPHRSTAPRKPCIAATSPFPSSGSDHRRRRICRLQRVPEPAIHPCSSAVSPRIISPFFPALSRPLGPSPTAAESFTPPAMSPSWPRSP